jgi:hypothetical protein
MIDRQGYETITEYLDNEYPISSGNLLLMCDLKTDYLNEQTAEFGEPNSHEAREVQELAAYRIADILDRMENLAGNDILAELGKDTIRKTAEMILARVIVEFRAIERHRNRELDHECESEFCPLADLDNLADHDYDQLNENWTISGSMPMPTQINEQVIRNDEWAGEWE